jgi:nucleoside-diphosphate kinase
MTERTLGIIKPDAVAQRRVGDIIGRIEAEGFSLRAMKMLHLTKSGAEGFYAVHRGRPFFEGLTTFMSSGPCVVLLLEREGAIAHWRAVMGATDPAKAADGTIRQMFGSSIEHNAVHGSDAPETAAFEIGYFFNALEVT